jgi:hypothetical protein
VTEGSIEVLSRQAVSGGNYVIEIETKEPKPQLVDTIRKIKGVTNVKVKDDTLEITTSSDLRSEMAKVVVESGAPLIQMKVQEISVDDIYMKYFKENQ